jgi:hypothetical protein
MDVVLFCWGMDSNTATHGMNPPLSKIGMRDAC